MSTVSVYSVLDTKSGMYGPLITFVNDNTALRSFQEMIISPDENSLLSMYPTDYCLYCIGQFDNELGLLRPSPAPVLVCTGLDAATNAVSELRRRKDLRAKIHSLVSEDKSLSEIDSSSEDENEE